MSISIHALVKRATQGILCHADRQTHFNPRPRKEGDGCNVGIGEGEKDFNPRPRKEGDSPMRFTGILS